MHVFRPCFSRQATFGWFVIIILGFMVRLDHEGLTSTIRWLALPPECYSSLVHFFYSTAWNLDSLLDTWATWAINHCPVIEFKGRPLLIGDGKIVAKEARKMPGVKHLHQGSNNNSKKEFVFGHYFGFVGLLVGSLNHAFCLSLEGAVQDGVNELRPEKGFNGKEPTLVTRMANQLVKAAKRTGRCCYSTVDAYFSVGPMFLILKSQVNENKQQWVHIITRAKDNYVAYHFKKGEKRFSQKLKFHLMEIFDHPHLFKKAHLEINGKKKTVLYYCANFLWKPVDDFLRFVWIIDGDQRFVLMGSDLNLDPLSMITIYHYRVKIEVMFFALVHYIGGFCYHFWTKAFPKIKRSQKLEYDALTEKEQLKLKKTLTAVERFVNLAAMTLGILQYLSLTATTEIWNGDHGWFRTYSSGIPSERIVQNVIKNEFFHNQHKVPPDGTLKMINEKKQKVLKSLDPVP